MEIWRKIKGYDGYEISNYGRVKSLSKKVKTEKGYRITTEKILKPFSNGHGYLVISLGRGVENRRYIHRAVAEAFLPNPENLPEVNHKDECKSNNFVWVNPDGTVNLEKSNLEWCDRQYNTTYGTMLEKRQQKVDQYTKDGVYVKTWNSIREANLFFNGRKTSHIGDCCLGKRKKAFKYVWRYSDENSANSGQTL